AANDPYCKVVRDRRGQAATQADLPPCSAQGLRKACATIRLSLAGAQDKLPVLVVDGRIALPLHGAPSSHILKPAIRRIADSVHNEGFCLALAKAVDLNAVAAEIRDAQGRPYLLVERYGRVRGPDNRPRRVHQEDFCQALGVAPEYKYQNEG